MTVIGGEHVVPKDDWFDVEDEASAEDAMLTMPLYDEDGNEIPDEEMPWNNMPEETSVADDSWDWLADAADEVEESMPPFCFSWASVCIRHKSWLICVDRPSATFVRCVIPSGGESTGSCLPC